jgi:hypothetical protein
MDEFKFSNTFNVRVGIVESFNFRGVQGDLAIFEIVDLINVRFGGFVFTGLGFGLNGAFTRSMLDKPGPLFLRKTVVNPFTGLSKDIMPELSPTNLSGSMTGPPTRVRVIGPTIRVEDFEGDAQLFQDPGITLGPISTPSKVRLSVESKTILEAGARLSPSIIPMKSGKGFSVSLGSATMGTLVQFAGGPGVAFS